ncbi:Osmotin, thaumatin-like protein [Hesseltinella vesiculosa]|uniref:Osmotin, thaumatin-like protein n=1 Tax=Hesseltinella vesiculosa TaxID=101127 RepID=A0A1X2GIW5_9FUNG|nr:Osmotin, thaumatin-like protein [Hesseltinella vesiculosa]
MLPYHPSLVFFFNLFAFAASSKTIIVSNQCPFEIEYRKQTNGDIISEKHLLQADDSHQFQVEATWAGRVWGQMACHGSSCELVDVDHPASLAEFTMTAANDQDYYDISFVDGYNLPMSVAPGQALMRPITAAMEPRRYCEPVICATLPTCPPDLIHNHHAINGSSLITCQSACSRYQQNEYCCQGEFDSPDTCTSNPFARAVKEACSDVYTYPYDDSTSMFACSDSTYRVTFCP